MNACLAGQSLSVNSSKRVTLYHFADWETFASETLRLANNRVNRTQKISFLASDYLQRLRTDNQSRRPVSLLECEGH